MSDFTKVVFIGTRAVYNRRAKVFCSIKFEGGRLSITGVEGPMSSGNAIGSCGQIDVAYSADDEWSFAAGWNPAVLSRFAERWSRWHLNDMRAGSPRQEEFLRKNGHGGYDAAIASLTVAGLQPDDGYRYGSAWLNEEVPEEVLAELRNLPDSDLQPAWV